MKNLSRRILRSIFDACPDGVAIIEAGNRALGIVSVNDALETCSGYNRDQIMGEDFLFMSPGAADPAIRDQIRQALDEKIPVSVCIIGKNIEGEAVTLGLEVVPVRDGRGNITHFAGFYRPLGRDPQPFPQRVEEVRSEPDPPPLVRNDKVTGILSRDYFDEMYERYWRMARRDNKELSVIMFEPDYFAEFTGTFGVAAVNGCLRRLATVIDGSFRRAGDLVARFEDQKFVAAILDQTPEQALEYGSSVIRRIRDLYIHHPKSPIAKHITMSVGVATIIPDGNKSAWALLELANQGVEQAHAQGHDRVCVYTPI